MTESELKMLMKQYQKKMLDSYDETEKEFGTHEFSKSYEKRMKKLFWSEKYFNKRIKLGYAMRKVAMVAVVVLSLVIASQVSAKVFHFQPWKYLPIFDKEEPVETQPEQKLSMEPTEKTKEKKESKLHQEVKGKDSVKNGVNSQEEETKNALGDGSERDSEKPVNEIEWEKLVSTVKMDGATFSVRLSMDASVCWITSVELKKETKTLDIPESIDETPVVRLGTAPKSGDCTPLIEDSDIAEKIEKINLPDSIERIEDGSFTDFKALKIIDLPQAIRMLPSHLFEGCESIKEFGLKEKNSHYENLNDFIVNKETGEIVYVPYGAEKLVIPASVKVLKSYFMRGLKAKEIVIPASVKTIEKFALDGPNLQEITLLEGNKSYVQKGTCICTKDGKTLVAVASKSGVVNVPQSVTVLGDGISIGSRDKLKRVLLHSQIKRFKKGWQSIFLCSHWQDVTLQFLGETPPEVDEYSEYSEEDETGEEVVFSGDEYVIENPVLINGDAQEAFEEWEYELPNLTVR